MLFEMWTEAPDHHMMPEPKLLENGVEKVLVSRGDGNCVERSERVLFYGLNQGE